MSDERPAETQHQKSSCPVDAGQVFFDLPEILVSKALACIEACSQGILAIQQTNI